MKKNKKNSKKTTSSKDWIPASHEENLKIEKMMLAFAKELDERKNSAKLNMRIPKVFKATLKEAAAEQKIKTDTLTRKVLELVYLRPKYRKIIAEAAAEITNKKKLKSAT